MAPARHSFRVSRATTSGQTQYTKRGPAAIQKRTRASQADKFRFELFEDASAAFADFKNGLQYMQHRPCQEFEFTEGTPSFARIGQVCKYRGYNDALLFPQLYVTSDGYKVAYCHVCNEDYSVTNYSKVKTRHSSSDEHLTQVAKLLRVDPNCLRNPYRCFVASCSYSVGGEREDTVLRHYKTAHLGLSPDQPIPNDIKMAIDNYKRAMQTAWSEGSDFTGYPVPSRLTTPESSPALATSLAYLSPPSTQRSASIVSSSSSVAPSTPIDDIHQEWSSPSQALSPIDSELKLDAWFPDLDAGPCLSFPEPQPDLFPALGSPSSFPFEPTQSFLDSPFDFPTISLTDDMPLEFPELVDNASHSESPSWDFSQLEDTPPSLTDFDFDFSQASGLDTEFDWGFDLSSFSS